MKRLDPACHAWMTSPHARAVADALEAARPGGSRFVGGCVRNAIRGEPVADIDIATQLVPDAVTDALEAAGVKAVPTAIEHGTVTAVADGQPVEITTLRRDVSTDGRRAVVAFTEDWDEDSARRDFRLNAIYAAFDGTLHDPQDGIEDAVAGRIAFIGDPDDRIREDYLRILRFFRFFAWYGHGAPDREGMLACARNKDGLQTLSAERVWAELKRLLGAPDPSFALRWMWTASILETVTGSKYGVDAIAGLVSLERAHGWEPDPLLRFMALLPPRAARARDLAQGLRLSKNETARLMAWAALEEAGAPIDALQGPALDAALYRDGAEPHLDRARLAWAADTEAGLGPVIERIAAWRRPDFPVRGQDLIERGHQPGEALGEALEALERRWIESGFTLTREQLLQEA